LGIVGTQFFVLDVVHHFSIKFLIYCNDFGAIVNSKMAHRLNFLCQICNTPVTGCIHNEIINFHSLNIAHHLVHHFCDKSGARTYMDNIGERLKIIRGKTNQSEFADMIGVSRNTLLRYERGDSVPDSKLAALICQKFNIPSDWFLFGAGELKKESRGDKALEPSCICQDSKIEEDENGDLTVPVLNSPDVDEYNYVPMVEAQLSAGGGSFMASERIRGYYAFRKAFIANVATSPKKLILMRVSGDSMDPEIRNGATVMVDLGRKRIKSNCIFAIGLGDSISIKTLEMLPGGRVRVISKNRTEYPPYEAEVKDLRIIGQVIWGDRLYPL